MNVCLFGSAKDAIPESYKADSFALGQYIARGGHTLVFGAGTRGVMGAAARGAAAAGGKIVGIVPTFFDKPGILFPDCTELCFTDDMWDRKLKFRSLADCYVVAPGGVGTLDEFFEVLTLKNLDRQPKPIAVLNTEGWFDIVSRVLRQLTASGLVSGDVPGMLTCCPDAAAVQRVLGL